ncbi:MAG: alginate O-acetyltransferase AlgX-related protein [Eubacteriales bacterium]|jgi:hypothetical protein|nr:hypothetical protein [Clostridiales bacterium]
MKDKRHTSKPAGQTMENGKSADTGEAVAEKSTHPPGAKHTFSNIRRISDAVVLGIFIFLVFLPMTLLAATGRTSSPLSFEAMPELPEATLKNYLDGKLTNGFQEWFSKSWPLRSTLVLAYNQFVYDLENIGAAPDLGGVDVLDNTPAETDDTTEEVPQGPEILEFNPLYAEINRLRMEQEMIEPTGYKGTDQVIIGKSGYLYENGYINEYLGYSKMYREVTRETIDDQVRKLEYIQEKLAERGTAFVLLITPSKASQYPDAIPDWYKAANTAPEDYVRPYTMLIERLADSTVSYVDCASLYKEIGLQDTFPKTGIHWNKLAAVEAIRAVLASYEQQTGRPVRQLAIEKINKSKNPPGFGNPEQDIFGLVYSVRPNARKIVDDWYYWPEVYVENQGAERISVFVQGGSFTHDINTYLPMYKISKKLRSVYYNQDEKLFADNATVDKQWDRYLSDCDLVIFECNEQFVRGFGGNAPRWAQADVIGYDIGPRVYESLYNYLQRNS